MSCRLVLKTRWQPKEKNIKVVKLHRSQESEEIAKFYFDSDICDSHPL